MALQEVWLCFDANGVLMTSQEVWLILIPLAGTGDRDGTRILGRVGAPDRAEGAGRDDAAGGTEAAGRAG